MIPKHIYMGITEDEEQIINKIIDGICYFGMQPSVAIPQIYDSMKNLNSSLNLFNGCIVTTESDSNTEILVIQRIIGQH